MRAANARRLVAVLAALVASQWATALSSDKGLSGLTINGLHARQINSAAIGCGITDAGVEKAAAAAISSQAEELHPPKAHEPPETTRLYFDISASRTRNGDCAVSVLLGVDRHVWFSWEGGTQGRNPDIAVVSQQSRLVVAPQASAPESAAAAIRELTREFVQAWLQQNR